MERPLSPAPAPPSSADAPAPSFPRDAASGTAHAEGGTGAGESLTSHLARRGFSHRSAGIIRGREIILGSTPIGIYSASGGWELLRRMPVAFRVVGGRCVAVRA